MIWDTAFEGTPAGSDFGSVTSVKLRELKQLFKTMLSKEHTFDESISPVMTHKVGYCSIIGRDTEQIGYNALAIVDGTLKYNDGSQYLYIGSFNHQDLVDRDLDDAHTQYVLKSDSIFEDIQVASIRNIGNVIYPEVKDDTVVVRGDNHKADTGDGSPNHVDGCVPASDIQCGSLNPDAVAISKVSTSSSGTYKPSAAFRANLTGYDSTLLTYYSVKIFYDSRSTGGSIQFSHGGDTLQWHNFAE